MPIGNAAATVASMIEKVHGNDLDDMFQLDSVLWGKIKARPKDSVSNRPERIVFPVSPGGKSRATDLDGGDLGRGGAPQNAFGTVAPYAFDWIMEWTKLAEVATDSREKSVINYVQQVLNDHTRIAAFNIDSLLTYSNGANELGTVTSYDNVNFIIYVDNATRFYDGQDIDVYNSGVGTAKTATITILTVDGTAKALYLGGAPSANPTANAVILENNSAGTANSGVYGMPYWQQVRTTGTYYGSSVTAYPGKFSTPTVNAGGATLTPALARLMLAQLKLARGVQAKPSSDAMFHMGEDQLAAWENTGIVVTENIQTGDSTARDMLAKNQIKTIGGIPILENIKAIPGRIDLLDFSTIYRTEVQSLDFYEVGGQRIFWPMGASGGIAAAMLSYMVWMGNFVCENPRRNAFISNLAIPNGY